jgi:membrane protein implicated in regulation of membrane protease activity
VAYIVTTPLVTAMTVDLLHAIAEQRPPGARSAILAGLEAFTPLFLAVLVAAAGIAIGLFLLILPGVYLAVRWYFVPQTVVIDGRRRSEALARSGELVQGSWWRVFGIGLLTALVVGIPAQLIELPFEAGASGADSAALSLTGATIAQVLAAPLIAIVSTLLYYDLRARREAPPPER